MSLMAATSGDPLAPRWNSLFSGPAPGLQYPDHLYLPTAETSGPGHPLSLQAEAELTQRLKQRLTQPRLLCFLLFSCTVEFTWVRGSCDHVITDREKKKPSKRVNA